MNRHFCNTNRNAIVALAGAALLFGAVASPASAAPAVEAAASMAEAKQVDELLAAWNKPGMPGAAVAVLKDGKVVYKRGVGMADIEHETPITPATPFNVASVSKQFTAFAIHLLVQDGKLSLDDDIRKYLPELHDFGKTITVAHLLHHTSGLRDQLILLEMAGWRRDDVITDDDILGLIQRQRALNFEPGSEYWYSNTGYTLLALIVKRVSGQPLPAFAEKHIFAPLGMKHTHFQDNYRTLVKGRALSYGPSSQGDSYENVALLYSNVGPSNLYTTIEDLALWDSNFYDGRVGGKALLNAMRQPGVLRNGKATNYGSGLVIGGYRGQKTIGHSGAHGGFRSTIIRFPDQRFSVVVLTNDADYDPEKLAIQIAEIYLAAQLKPAAPVDRKSAPVEVKIDPARLDAFVGEFALSPQFAIRFTKENGGLVAQATGQGKLSLYATGERTFVVKGVDAKFTFDEPGQDGVVAGGTLHQNGDKRAVRTSGPAMSEAELGLFAGEFYSDELRTLYLLSVRNGKLVLAHPRGEFALDFVEPNVFAAQYPLGRIEFQCQAGKACSGFTVSNAFVRKLQFNKVTLTPAKPAENRGKLSAAAP